jgi:predicted lipoprotein with Yx(FWY)xxD motif
MIKAVQHPSLGTILTDSDGRVLYRFTRDVVNTSSACYNQCATNWPPLLVAEGDIPLADEGVNGNLLGILTRTDGTRQVMYNGMPLYYFARDGQAGDTNGQRVNNVWFIVHPNTTTSGNLTATILVRQHPTLGSFITDGDGKTLYLFTRDSADKTVCYDRCATAWPPLLVGGTNEPQLGAGVSGKVGTILRDDGNRQVTYESKPLYYFVSDTTVGDTKGQGVNNVWYVIPPVATAAPAAAPAETPAALPNTGSESFPIGIALALALIMIAVGGAMGYTTRRR